MSDGSLALTLLRAVFSLALVLGLLVFFLRVLARRSGFAPAAGTPVGIDVLGRRQLTRAASLQVVRVAGRVLVVGVTDSEVSVLTELSPEELPADEKREGSEDDRPGVTSSALVEALRRQGTVGRLVADMTGRSSGGRHRGGSRV